MMTGEIYSFYIDLKSNGRGLRWASNRIKPFILHWDNVLVLPSHDIGSTPLEWLVAFWGLTYNILVKTTNSLFSNIVYIFHTHQKMHFLYSYKKCQVCFPKLRDWDYKLIERRSHIFYWICMHNYSNKLEPLLKKRVIYLYSILNINLDNNSFIY